MDTVIRAQTRIKDIKRITLKLPRIRCSFPTLFPPFFGVDRSKNLRTNFPKLFPLSLSLCLSSQQISFHSLCRILHFCDWEKSQRIEKRFTYTRSTCCWREERKEGRKEGSRDSIKIRLETGCGRTTLILVELILKINRIFVVPPMILLFSPGGREGGDGLLDVTILAE